MVKTKEIVKIVQILNEEYMEVNDDDEYLPFEFVYQYCDEVKFLGRNIWCEDDDCRPEDEETGELIPLIDHLRNQAFDRFKKVQNMFDRTEGYRHFS